jgi:hypothetical protein
MHPESQRGFLPTVDCIFHPRSAALLLAVNTDKFIDGRRVQSIRQEPSRAAACLWHGSQKDSSQSYECPRT